MRSDFHIYTEQHVRSGYVYCEQIVGFLPNPREREREGERGRGREKRVEIINF